MTAFDECSAIGEAGLKDVLRLLDSQSDDRGRVVRTDKGRLSKDWQKRYGDAFMQKNGRVYAVEVKCEEKCSDNLFLETWSNFTRQTPGWMWTLDADILLYYFVDVGVLYSISFQALKRWAVTTNGAGVPNLDRYVEKQQRKRDQMNDTRGRCVPLKVICSEVGYNEYRLVAGEWVWQEEAAVPAPEPMLFG